MSKLLKILEFVEDEKTFVDFLSELYKDRLENTSEWENGTIESYLDSCIAWHKDSSQHAEKYSAKHKKSEEENIWRKIAEILYAGKIYE